MATVTRHLIDRGDGALVELFQAQTPNTPNGAILFVHGFQRGLLLGGKEAVDSGTLTRFSSRFNITAAAISQPGFGASDGPFDFCGPITQQAISAAIQFMQHNSFMDLNRFALFGNSRGAVASAMVATKIPDLGALILMSGVYDLKAAYQLSSAGIRQAIETEAGLSDKAFADRSALLHASKIRAETLILHGTRDDRAPFDQANKLAAELSKVGTAVTLRTFDCGHRIPQEQTAPALRDFLERIFAAKPRYH
ncbi:prolyl oligopeptidase family serine peptidase [Rhizobiaceae bacterium n13]|uniref:Prolyl oligopeptidase family serine peptidase n=1 Tax=Ferirhizobium litorale TaxID=2927786 RepID=A0AAE3QEB8_9HYPH|nr:prolyl oligopeptidase family serine peptidase [Fererhizobium litorale]MDI7863955.1 prolyl oligopeptidase family serine peptidase [Fererhizobium litorale]MDI7924212.1 prolyl oligopeptidase family serine peptidase [Fererhizobium litorale]